MLKEGNGINEVGDHLIRILISKEENQGKVYTHKNLKTKQRLIGQTKVNNSTRCDGTNRGTGGRKWGKV